MGFPGGSDGKESACNVGDQGLIPGLGRSPGGGHGHPLQYSYLNTVHGITESDTTEWLSIAQPLGATPNTNSGEKKKLVYERVLIFT